MVACSSVIPVNRKQLGSTLKVSRHLFGILLIAFARQVELCIGWQYTFHIWQATPISSKLEIEPSAEEIELPFDKVTFLLRGILQQTTLQSFKTEIGLTNGIPATTPQSLSKTVSINFPASIQETVTFTNISAVVTTIDSIPHQTFTITGSNNLIVTPVEGAYPVMLGHVGDNVIHHFDKSLEVIEVLERIFC